MESRIQIVAVVGSLLLLILVLELVRRKRFLERYALMWLFSAFVLFLLAALRPALHGIATAIGIYYPPSALFFIAFAFVLALLLHFSLAVSRLSEQNKTLAQRLSQLECRVQENDEQRVLTQQGHRSSRFDKTRRNSEARPVEHEPV